MDLGLFRERFVFASDAYGIEKPFGPDAIRSPLTDELLQDHLDGKRRIGAYIIDADGYADQIVIDLDIPKEKVNDLAEWERVRAEAKQVVSIYDDLGVEAFITSSKSRGYHVRSLWQRAPAGDLRRAGEFVTRRAGIRVEVFPKQNQRKEGGLGSFVWLPLHGNSLKDGKTAILDQENGLAPLPDQWAALRDVRRNSLETLGSVLAVVEEWERENGPEAPTPASSVGDKIAAGERNATLTSLAGTMQRRGMAEAALEAALLAENRAKCSPPLPDAEVRGIVASVTRYTPATTFNLTDLGNAKRLVAQYRDRIRYCRTWKTWMVHDGTRWSRDDTGQVHRYAKQVTRDIYHEAGDDASDGRRKELSKHAMKTEGENRIEAMISLAKTEEGIAIRPADMDRHPLKLNVLNGTLNLTEGKLYSHSPDDLITQLAPVSFDEEATFPLWTKFLDDIFLSRKELIWFIHQFFGYCASGSTKEQVFVIGYGEGSNGKTVLLETVSAVLGDYAQPAPFSTFTMKRTDNTRNDLAGLHNARLVTSSESTEGMRFDEELLKRLTGDEKVTARFLYGEFFDYMPKFKLFLASNHLPKIKGTDYAIWRRVKLAPFQATFTDDKGNRDRDIKGKLLAEASGILNWIVSGAKVWSDIGLGEAEEIKAATGKYREGEDMLGNFLAECCEHNPELEQPARDLFLAYKEYCGGRAGNEKDFSQAMRRRGYGTHRKKKGTYWTGLTLVADRREET